MLHINTVNTQRIKATLEPGGPDEISWESLGLSLIFSFGFLFFSYFSQLTQFIPPHSVLTDFYSSIVSILISSKLEGVFFLHLFVFNLLT